MGSYVVGVSSSPKKCVERTEETSQSHSLLLLVAKKEEWDGLNSREGEGLSLTSAKENGDEI